MKLIKNIDDWVGGPSAVTTGNFDGVHRGHQFLLRQLVEKARLLSVPAVVVMFYPHPKQVLNTNSEPYLYLSNEEDRLAYMAECGVDFVVQLEFNKEMATWGADDFVKKVLVDSLQMSFFLMGYDHRLGNPKYSSDMAYLSQKYAYEWCRSEPYYFDDVLVSSTVVRASLQKGDIALANRLLGREYGFACHVVSGKRIGRTIGYPTANLETLSPSVFLPKEGVYVVRVSVDGEWYGGMMQLGSRPTLEDDRGVTLEVHIFDFKATIYGQTVDLVFCHFIRDIVKFDSLDSLVNQLQEDERSARAYLG